MIRCEREEERDREQSTCHESKDRQGANTEFLISDTNRVVVVASLAVELEGRVTLSSFETDEVLSFPHALSLPSKTKVLENAISVICNVTVSLIPFEDGFNKKNSKTILSSPSALPKN
jgi:hypothetical protein